MKLIEDKAIFQNKEYYVYHIAGYTTETFIHLAEKISILNNIKTMIVSSEICLHYILPNDLQYRHVLSFKENRYFETAFLGYRISTNNILLNKILNITKPTTEHPLFFISTQNNKIMENVAYIALS